MRPGWSAPSTQAVPARARQEEAPLSLLRAETCRTRCFTSITICLMAGDTLPDSVENRLDQEDCRWAECEAPPSVPDAGSVAGGATLERGGEAPGLQDASGGTANGEVASWWPPAAPARAPGAGTSRPRWAPPVPPARCSSQDQIRGREEALGPGPGLARAAPSGRAARLPPPALPLLLLIAVERLGSEALSCGGQASSSSYTSRELGRLEGSACTVGGR